MGKKISHLPVHVAIIPDGNRRWAKDQGLKPWEGHRKGAEVIEHVIKEALRLEVKHLTFWGSSEDNLQKRPLQERKALLDIYEQYFKKLIQSDDVFENKARINIVGKWKQQFPKKLISILKDGIEKTKGHSNYFLNFLLAYNGSSDMIQAVKKIAKSICEGDDLGKINQALVQSSLMSSQLPNVDLLIRTGVDGDPHNSAGFLMWQTQNSQFYFTEKMFPDFGADEFRKAIDEYAKRARRFGG